MDRNNIEACFIAAVAGKNQWVLPYSLTGDFFICYANQKMSNDYSRGAI